MMSWPAQMLTLLLSLSAGAVTGCGSETGRVTTSATLDDAAEDGSTAEGRACGSRGLRPCPEGYFCEFSPGADCGRTDRGGTCAERPLRCEEPDARVCGCDGQTYDSGCEANAQGTSVARPGACVDAGCERGGCGGELCVTAGSAIVSVCMAEPVHACFRDAECRRQTDGECGFTDTPELRACVARYRE